jgi:hypothetical protein
MADWESPRSASSLLYMAKFASSLGEDLDKVAAAAAAGEAAAGPETGGLAGLAAGAAEALELLHNDVGNLDLWFQNGRVYTFFGVPRSVYTDLLNASSPGSYYNQNIRGRYSG